MATLLIETKEVRALQIQLDDLHALIKAVYKTEGYLIRTAARAEVLVDVGSFVQRPMSPDLKADFERELQLITPMLFARDVIQDLVNRGDLPEAHYLINYGRKRDEFVSGGKVNASVLNLQASIASGLTADAAALELEKAV